MAHLNYMRALAGSIVERHINAIRKVATALDEHTVLDGHQIDDLVRSSRCVCHSAEWVDKPKELANLRS